MLSDLHCCSSVPKSCPTLCNRMDHSEPGLPVLYNLEFTHVYWVGDAIQPFHPLSPPSPAFNLSQSQGLFQWVGSLHQASLFLYFIVYLFIYDCPGSSLLQAGFVYCGEWGLLSCSVWASYCRGFSCCRVHSLGVWASVVTAHGLHRIFPDWGSNPCPLNWQADSLLGHQGSSLFSNDIIFVSSQGQIGNDCAILLIPIDYIFNSSMDLGMEGFGIDMGYSQICPEKYRGRVTAPKLANEGG